ncbi:hypothetical protein ACTJJB_31840 [Chitinophaga sp. 22536]|uniref:hypothetical protein n=1 Tax=unclassified Chitinophaga TaxID=2619133 RepID=UPI003F8452CA
MSSLIALKHDDGFIIATDTLSHKKTLNTVVPLNLTSKTTCLPQFKLCYATQGFSILNQQIFCFGQETVKAVDITGFLDSFKAYFLTYIDIDYYPTNHIGTIYFFGYSNQSQSLQSFKLVLSKNKGIELTDLTGFGFLMKPGLIQNEHNLILKKYGNDHIAAIIELMNKQKKEDMLMDISERVVIGGQIQLTVANLDEDTKEMIFSTTMIHKFHDFEEVVADILNIKAQ